MKLKRANFRRLAYGAGVIAIALALTLVVSAVVPDIAELALAEFKQVVGPGLLGVKPRGDLSALAVNSGPLIPGAHGGDVVITPTYDVVNFPGNGVPVLQTPHSVPNSYLAGTSYFRGIWGPSTAEIHFSKIDTERNYDYVWIGRSDKSVYGTKVSGLYQDYWMGTSWGLNEPVYEWIQTDSSVQSWGYSADQFSGIWSNPDFNSVVPVKLSTIYGGGYYKNYEDVRWTVSVRGASAIKLHFKSIDLENNYDFLYFTDGNGYTAPGITGGAYKTSGYSTNYMQGSSIQVRLTSDSTVTYTGFELDQVYIQWQYGAFFGGYGPRVTTTVYTQTKSLGRGVFQTTGSLRDVNDPYTFAELDRTDSAGKRIKQIAYAPELPADFQECDPYYPQVGECRIHHFYPAAFEFKIRISDGSGPITVEDVYRDDTNPLPQAYSANVQFNCGPSVGIAWPLVTVSCGVNFSPTPNAVSQSIQIVWDTGRYEGRVLIPVSNGAGTTLTNAVGVIWRLKANTGTEGYYTFSAMTRIIIADDITGYSGSGASYWTDHYNLFASDVVASYTPTGGANHGWVQGMLDFGNDARRFSRDIRLADFASSGWRDKYTAANGWREMDNRHTYFTYNEAGMDAIAWARVRGPLKVAHTVTFMYLQYQPNAGAGTWYTLVAADGLYDTSWSIPLKPAGGFFMPAATWGWSGYNSRHTSPYGSFRMDVRIDGGLVAQISFYYAAT